MKKIKPIIAIIPEDTDDLFIDMEYCQRYRKMGILNEYFYRGLILGFGKNVFIFDIEACDFLIEGVPVDIINKLKRAGKRGNRVAEKLHMMIGYTNYFAKW